MSWWYCPNGDYYKSEKGTIDVDGSSFTTRRHGQKLKEFDTLDAAKAFLEAWPDVRWELINKLYVGTLNGKQIAIVGKLKGLITALYDNKVIYQGTSVTQAFLEVEALPKFSKPN